MTRNLVMLVAALSVVASGTLALADHHKAKYSIKEVMKQAHGKDSNLLKKVLGGDASSEEKTKLLDLYLSLTENQPKKGEASSWYAKSGAVVVAASKVVVGRDGALEELETATNCKACHSVHK